LKNKNVNKIKTLKNVEKRGRNKKNVKKRVFYIYASVYQHNNIIVLSYFIHNHDTKSRNAG